MKIQKNVVLLLIVALLTVGNVFANNNAETTQEDGKVTLELLNYLDQSESNSVEEWELILAAFEAAHPEITLEVENLFNDPYHQKLAAKAASGDMPDVFFLWPTERSGNIIRSGLIEPLEQYLDASLYAPGATAPQVDGRVWTLPYSLTACHVMYTNTKLLKENGLEAPKSYSDLVAMTPALQEKGLETVFMANKSAWVMNSCLFGTLIGKTGGLNFISQAVAGEKSFNDAEFVAALQMVANVYADGVVSPTTVQMDYGSGPNEYASEHAPFFIDGDWQTGAIETLLTPEQVEATEFLAFPSLPNEVSGPTTAMVAGTGMALPTGLEGAKKEAALTWIKFYAGPEAAKIRAELSGTPPAYLADMSAWDISPLSKKRFGFYGTVAGAEVVDAVIPTEVNEVLNSGMQELALGVKTAEEVAAEVEAAMAALR